MKRIHWQAIAGISISLLFLFLAFRNIRLAELWQAFGRVNGLVLLSALPLLGLYYVLFALRWRFILKPVGAFRFRVVLAASLIGFLGNNVLPARMGELIRIFFLSRKTDYSKSSLLSSVIVERLADMVVLLTLFALTLLFFSFPAWTYFLGWSTAALVLLGLTSLILLTAYEGKIVLALERFCRRLPGMTGEKMGQRLRFFNVPVQMLRQPLYTGSALALTGTLWALNIGITAVFLRGFALELALYQIIFIVVVTQLGTIIPSSPGYIGTYQYLWLLALGLFGVPKTEALAVALLFHAYWYIPTTLVGLFVLWHEGISLSKLRRGAESRV